MGELNARGQKLLGLAYQESQRMVRLIESVLQLEKLRSGAVALDRQPVPLTEVLQKSVEAMQLIAGGRSVVLDFQPTDLFVMADAAWLEQVFVNVLANAINYSPADSQVKVRAQATGTYAEVLIIDQGPGISEEEKSLIFERFHRVSVTALKVTGSGLGLTICKELVDLHHGYVKVESELGKGSTFVIGIPTASVASAGQKLG